MADNADLVQEMVQACQGHTELDESAFGQALSSDVALLDLANEGTLSTNLSDVFAKNRDEHDALDKLDVPLEDDGANLDHFKIPLLRKKTLSQIDVTAGTFRSKPLIVLLWATFAIAYFGFSSDIVTSGFDQACSTDMDFDSTRPWSTNLETLGCEIVLSIIRWLFFFVGMAGELRQVSKTKFSL